jgi:hypothetical protein
MSTFGHVKETEDVSSLMKNTVDPKDLPQSALREVDDDG